MLTISNKFPTSTFILGTSNTRSLKHYNNHTQTILKSASLCATHYSIGTFQAILNDIWFLGPLNVLVMSFSYLFFCHHRLKHCFFRILVSRLVKTGITELLIKLKLTNIFFLKKIYLPFGGSEAAGNPISTLTLTVSNFSKVLNVTD